MTEWQFGWKKSSSSSNDTNIATVKALVGDKEKNII